MLVIPTYNEKENIIELVAEIRKELGDILILFVDDSSPDGTADEIKKIQQSDSKIALLSRAKKGGLGSAYIDAFKHVLREKRSGAFPAEKYLITLDADLSHPIESVSAIIKALDQNDFAIGSRYLRPDSLNSWNWPRALLSRFANFYARDLLQLPIRDLTSGFVGYRIDALQEIDLDTIKSEGYIFQVELKDRLYKAGKTFQEIPITFKDRRRGKSKLNLKITEEAALYPAKIALQKFLGAPLLLFLTSFVLYAYTAPHTIYLNDNAEFATTALKLGIPHPSGYPLYVLLAWLFSKATWFLNPVYSINLFSGLFASLSLVLLYIIIKRVIWVWVGERTAQIGAFLFAFAFATTGIFWYQAVIAKVYTLNLFLVLLVFIFVDNFLQKRKPKYLLYSAGVLGLAASNHQMSILILPFLLPLFFLVSKDRLKTFAKSIGIFVLGLLPYLYLLIRPHFHPMYDWGHVEQGFGAFWREVSRAQYSDLSKSFDWGSKIKFFGDFIQRSFVELTPAVLLVFLGLFALRLQKRRIYLILSFILANTVLIILLRSLPYFQEGAEFYSNYYLPAFAMMVVLMSAGCVWLFSRKPKLLFLIAGIPLLIIAYNLYINASIRNYRHFDFIQNYYSEGLKSLPLNSVLLFGVENPAEDTSLFALAFEQDVERLRPDLQIVSYVDVFPQADKSTVDKIYQITDPIKRHNTLVSYAERAYPGRDLYATFPYTSDNFAARSNGYFYNLSGDRQTGNLILTQPSQGDIQLLSADFFGRQVLANFYYQRAVYELNHDTQAEQQDLLRAIQYDQEVLDWQFQTVQRTRAILENSLAINR